MIQTLFGSTEEKKTGLFDRMKQAVTRTRENLAERIEEVVSIGKEIDRNTLDDLEATLIGADLGSTTTQEVLGKLRDKADRKQIKNVQELKRLLKEELLAILNAANTRPVERVEGTPEVILVVGVNGTGKTTTIGKLSQVFRSQGKNVLMCAADTFRAAAIDQLEIWGQRTGTEVIKTKPGGDPAAVLFDALQAATARKMDYVIVDTAGRLHTKTSLMSELEKMRRTAQRIIPGAPHETLLVMDATTGQNGLQQARLFTAIGRSYRHRPHQTRRHGEGRRSGRYLARVGIASTIRWRGRESWRFAAVRSKRICGFAVRIEGFEVKRSMPDSYPSQMPDRATDEQFLHRALDLARKGIGLASPDPYVGAVIVDSGRSIAGTGFYTYDGVKHAEVLALEQAGAKRAAERSTSIWNRTAIKVARLLAPMP